MKKHLLIALLQSAAFLTAIPAHAIDLPSTITTPSGIYSPPSQEEIDNFLGQTTYLPICYYRGTSLHYDYGVYTSYNHHTRVCSVMYVSPDYSHPIVVGTTTWPTFSNFSFEQCVAMHNSYCIQAEYYTRTYGPV